MIFENFLKSIIRKVSSENTQRGCEFYSSKCLYLRSWRLPAAFGKAGIGFFCSRIRENEYIVREFVNYDTFGIRGLTKSLKIGRS